jgi:hypothetical protein
VTVRTHRPPVERPASLTGTRSAAPWPEQSAAAVRPRSRSRSRSRGSLCTLRDRLAE